MTERIGLRIALTLFMTIVQSSVLLAQTGNAPPPSAADGRETIAVLDFEASGATKEQVAAVTDSIRQALLETRKFRLVDRAQMDAILKEQALQQTGCTSQECAAQVGKILGAQAMITGRLSKVGAEGWVLSASLTSVESGEVLRSSSVERKGDFFGLLSEDTAKLARELVSGLGQNAPVAKTAAPPKEKELVAVMEFDARGATPEEASAVTDRIRQRLLESQRFRLVERSQMDAILKEQAFQQTGCTSKECAVQAGKVLGVRKIITGNLARVGSDQWFISASMTDVETGETLRSVSTQRTGDFFSVLSEGTATLTLQLIGQGGEGLTEFLRAAGAKVLTAKDIHSGFGLGLILGSGTATVGLPDGRSSSFQTSAKPHISSGGVLGQVPDVAGEDGFYLDYLWAIWNEYSAGVFYTIGTDNGSLPAKNCSGCILQNAFQIYGIEGRYWWSRKFFTGLKVALALEDTRFTSGTESTGIAYTEHVPRDGNFASRSGSMFGLDVGYQFESGCYLQVEYWQATYSGSISGADHIPADTYAPVLLGFGYRFL